MADNTTCSKYSLVVAFDFGTTFSGYAYSFRDQFDANNLDISVNSAWTTGSERFFSKKTPSSLLLSPKKEFLAFGNEAETMYIDLAQEEKHTDYYFFRRFKMKLHNRKDLKRGLKMKDEGGKPLHARSVFAFAIHGLKKHFLNELDRNSRGRPDDSHILYVITVPAIWTDSAKQFMREAAIESGIEEKNVILALEPEVASLYCQLLPIDKLHTSKEIKFTVARPGTVFMVVDLGGGTADITVHERQNDGTLKEKYAATGGPWGGVGVDRQYLLFMAKILGPEVMKQFTKESPDDLFEMYKSLETLKRTIKPSTTGKIQIEIPSTLCEIYRKEHDEKFGSKIPDEFKNSVVYNSYKLKVDVEVIKSFFKPIADDIISHMKDIISKPECQNVKNILMVGGFSESSMINEAVETAFPDCRMVVPYESELVVLKGAVIYGHKPNTISCRVMRYTYGVSYMVEFLDGVHPEEKKKQKEGETPKCKDLFEKFVEIGQTVDVGQVFSKVYNPARDDQQTLLIKIYASTQKSPEYVTDEGCWKLGKLSVQLPTNNKNTSLNIEEKMIFGETELRLEAVEPSTGLTFTAQFDFL